MPDIPEPEIAIAVVALIGIFFTLVIATLLLRREANAHQQETKRLMAVETALREQHNRFQATLDHAPVMVIEKDLEGRITFVNRAFLQWTGRTVADVIGKTSHDLLPKDSADAHAAVEREVIERNAPVQRELTVPLPLGERRILLIKFPLRNSDNTVNAIGTVAADVTETRQTEERVAHAQKMEAIGQLTGGVAHDFNNLLTAMRLNADVLAARITDETLHPVAEAIRIAAESGGALTKRLLTFASRQVLEPQPTDVSELVADMEQLLRRTLGAHIDIELRAAEDLWLAKVDPAQLENALLNLALNARDAMPSGGRLTIETRNVDLDERDARPNGIEPGAYVMVAVGDDGIGMTPPVMTRAFEPFFTTKDVGKGTGLGLSMVYGFAKQSGGHVKIQSAVNVGTVVKLYLPRSAAEAARFGSRPSFPVDLPTGTEAILLIEDDPLVRMHVADLLGSLGYRITAVENAVQALAVLEDSPTPDLLFTDIVMPGGINGFDLVRRVRERWPRVKVLMMTGYPGTPETAEKQIGGTTMLGKPFSRSEVASKIRQVLDEPAVEAGAGMDAARYVA